MKSQCSCCYDQLTGSLFDGLASTEILWLLSDAPQDCVYIYDRETRSVSRASFRDVPWPVLFLLGSRHKKHRFLAKKTPSSSSLRTCIQDAIHKFKWTEFFKGASNSGPIHPSMVYSKKIRAFGLKASEQMHEFCHDFQHSMLDACYGAVKSRFGQKKRWANLCPIDRAAHSWLSTSSYFALPTDKCGGFCLIKSDDVRFLQLELLQGPWYRYLGQDIVATRWNAMLSCYTKICHDVCAVDPSMKIGLLMRSLEGGNSKAISRMIHTVKSHKPVGKVTLRAVHASPAHSFLGLMSWVTMVLTSVCKKYSHLLSSSDDLIARLNSSVTTSRDDVIVHVDLKDFYMTGDAKFLVHHVSLMVKRSIRAAFRNALTFLLEHQFISSTLFPGDEFEVIVGSGMGLRSSSTISNCAFLHAVELCGLRLLHKHHAFNRYSVKHYYRYADNLLFWCAPDFARIKLLLFDLENGMAPYQGLLEEASHVGVDFLDLFIYKDKSTEASGKMAYSPMLKKTSLQSTLSLFSAHPVGIHGAWMKSYVLNLLKHSSNLAWFRAFKEEVLCRLIKSGVDRSIVNFIDQSTQCTYPTPGFHRQVSSRPSSMWIRFPYHPVWSGAVNRCMDVFSAKHSYFINDVLGKDSLKAAWQLSSPALGAIVQRL